MTELAYKEELFFLLSGYMSKKDAEEIVEKTASAFKKVYTSDNKNKVTPITGNDLYRHREKSIGWGEYIYVIEKYVDNSWINFMSFEWSHKARLVVEQLKAGGNTIITA